MVETARIEFATATDGTATVTVNGIAVHSRYNPTREAERLVAAQLGRSAPDTVILFEPGLGYLAAAARRTAADAQILAITFAPSIAARAMPLLAESGAEIWPHGGLSLDRFLENRIDDLQLASMAVVDPSVAKRCFPETHREVSKVLRCLLARQKASVATTLGFGRRWIRNAVGNVLRIERVAPLQRLQRPVVIAASGPSLEEVLPDLARLRPRFALWALPSALRALGAAGLEADLVVATDPGYYATAHLFRQHVPRVAMPLSAAYLPGPSHVPVSLFAEGHGFEGKLIAALGLDLPVIPPAGTVAATAIKLAEQSGAPAILVAGLDLCYRDLHGHARPSLSAVLLEERARRTQPYPTELFTHAIAHAPTRVSVRGTVIRRGPSLDAYASWFDRAVSSRPRAARLLPSLVSTMGLPGIAPDGMESALQAAVPNVTPITPTHSELSPNWPSEAARAESLMTLLANWARQLESASLGPTAPDLLRGTAVWHLAHYCQTGDLLRTRTAMRQGKEWVPTWRNAIQGCQRLVDNLKARVRAA